MSEFLIRNVADIEEIERVPITEHIKARNTYEMLCQGAAINPQKVAIHFMMSGHAYDNAIDITCEQLLGRVHQTANLFHDLCVRKDDVITLVLSMKVEAARLLCWYAAWLRDMAAAIPRKRRLVSLKMQQLW